MPPAARGWFPPVSYTHLDVYKRQVKGDITDREAVETLFAEEKPDIVVNFAAETHVDRSVNDPGLFLRTNILGTQTLMAVAYTHL